MDNCDDYDDSIYGHDTGTRAPGQNRCIREP